LKRTLVVSFAVAIVAGCGSSGTSTGGASEPTRLGTSTPQAQATGEAAPTSTTEPTPMSIAPGEAWIVYTAPFYERDRNVGNRLVRPDGSDDHWATPQVPLPKDGWQVHPDWSPDGSLLAFIADDAADGDKPPELWTRDLWITEPDGTDAERLLDCALPCVTLDWPAWSRDGTKLAFTAHDETGGGASFRLDVMDMTTRAVTTVAIASGPTAFAGPRWSPDGRRVVLEVQRYTDLGPRGSLSGTAIAILDLKDPTPTPTVITDWALWATYPDWHPTEDLIVFSTRPWSALEDGPSNLHTVRPDGSELTALTEFTNGQTRATQPTWTPEGTEIIFTAVEGTGFGEPTMAIVHRDGTALTSATSSGPMFGTHPRLRPQD
jgi:Tol biopolymer transport system component